MKLIKRLILVILFLPALTIFSIKIVVFTMLAELWAFVRWIFGISKPKNTDFHPPFDDILLNMKNPLEWLIQWGNSRKSDRIYLNEQ